MPLIRRRLVLDRDDLHDRQPELFRGGVELRALLTLRGRLGELVGLSIDLRLVRIARLNSQQNVVQRHGVTLSLVEPNEVITKLRQHWLRDIAHLERIGSLFEGSNEAPFGSL